MRRRNEKKYIKKNEKSKSMIWEEETGKKHTKRKKIYDNYEKTKQEKLKLTRWNKWKRITIK